MAFWNRDKAKGKVVPPELQQYYDAERRERSGLAWLLALVSVACVALLVIGAFFGGRWLYRTVSNKDKDNTVVTTQGKPSDKTPPPSVDGGPSAGDAAKPTTPTPGGTGSTTSPAAPGSSGSAATGSAATPGTTATPGSTAPGTTANPGATRQGTPSTTTQKQRSDHDAARAGNADSIGVGHDVRRRPIRVAPQATRLTCGSCAQSAHEPAGPHQDVGQRAPQGRLPHEYQIKAGIPREHDVTAH